MKRATLPFLLLLLGCDPGAPPGATEPLAAQTSELRVDVRGKTFVSLDPPGVVGGQGPWDLSFEGYDVFTNSGPSGPGKGSAFGPLGVDECDREVAIPFTLPDRPGGAFLDWYLYEGAPAHVLWSRYHVHGVRDAERLWKVQILGYYGQLDGAPVSALYRIRYAELTAQGEGPTVELGDLDASAGGTSAPAEAPSVCLDLATGQRLALTPAEAQASASWHLCFRRQSVLVNGGPSGPRGVVAVDLNDDERAGEQLAGVKARTAGSELGRFSRVQRGHLDQKVFIADGVKSVFGGSWVEQTGEAPAPRAASWVVVGADGQRRFCVVFSRFSGASGASPGSVFLEIKPDNGR